MKSVTVSSCPVRSRPGFTITELLVAAALLGTLFATSIPLLSSIRLTQQELERRCQAQQAVANLMEQVAALAVSGRLDALNSPEFLLPVEVTRVLPGSELDVAVARVNANPRGSRVTLRLSWLNHVDRRESPVELVAWFPDVKEQP